MPVRSQVLAGPVPVAGSGASVLSALVTADVLVRHASAAGHAGAGVATAVVAGGLCHLYAAEEELRREGLDKEAVGRHGFAARVDQMCSDARARVAALAAALGVGVDVEEAARAGEQSLRAARVAFVRLYEAGLVVDEERVVDVCPRCATVATGPDAVSGVLDAEALVLRLSVLDGDDAVGWLDVRCLAPELVPGVAAVAVPEGHPAAGRAVGVPVAETVVPVVADPSAAEPVLIVPAHDAEAAERARRAGVAAPAVVDATGTVRSPGPLEGLARHAARAAATRFLAAEGVVAAAEPAVESVVRCAACRTVLVPVVGRHWFLAMGDLLTAAADAVRDGRPAVSPGPARDALLALAADAEDWCLSRQSWAGQPLPVARCGDCGSVDVSVEASTSCPRCMGDLVPEDGVLDARFVSCLWPLSRAGWPDGGHERPDQGTTTLVVPADGLADVLAMAALGLRLDGAAPFAEVVVAPGGGCAERAGVGDVAALVESEGGAAVRVALLCGEPDLVAARDLVVRLGAPRNGDADVDRLEAACASALDAGTPATALDLLAAALAVGVPPGAEDRVRALAAPLLGG